MLSREEQEMVKVGGHKRCREPERKSKPASCLYLPTPSRLPGHLDGQQMAYFLPRTVLQVALVSLLAFILNPLSDNMGDNVGDKRLDRADASTVRGKFMMGYQGWFGCPGDGPSFREGTSPVQMNVAS